MQYIILFALFIGVVTSADNFIVVTETEGIAVTNYPLQFASPFLPGEISPYPVVLIDGKAVPTQANVKQRYPDGSVKHAIISIIVPSIAAKGSVKLTFTSQQSVNESPLSKELMLGSNFNFEATMELTQGALKISSNARTMLQSGDYTVWVGGEIATTVILADHSTARKYDIGFEAYKSFRPIYHATFWPALNMVNIRFVGELAYTEALQNQNVTNLLLTVGSTAPKAVYSLPADNSPLVMGGGTRWTKQAWLGGTVPSRLDIYHNLAYVAKTRFVFNFDTTKVIPESQIARDYASWNSSARDLYQAGKWTKGQGTTGGRPDIGPYPNWAVAWLFTGDWRLRDQAFGLADLSAAWRVHYREGRPDKRFLRTDTVNGTALGRVIAVTSRPTFTSFTLSYEYTKPAHKVVIVGPLSTSWATDLAHSPDIWSPIYALTGDFWYLEELWFWASWSTADPNGAGYYYPYGRGPTGAEGGLAGQVRAQAWALRTRVNAYYVSPDDAPEKEYFKIMTEDAIAAEEGARNLTESPYYGTPVWKWANSIRFKPGGNLASVDVSLPTLHQWQPGDPSFAQAYYGINITTAYSAVSLFEQNFMMLALGRTKELGFNASVITNYLAHFYIGAFNDPKFNPFVLGNGRVPTIRNPDKKYFATFEELMNGYDKTWNAMAEFDNTDSTHGYPFIALAATSMVAPLNGEKVWSFMQDQLLNASVLSSNPKWAIVPRWEDSIPSSPLQNQPFYLPPTSTPSFGSNSPDLSNTSSSYSIQINVLTIVTIIVYVALARF